MEQVELKPLGRRVSCIGFGCARLDGRVGLRQSARLLEAALELGITYFDVAAAYGTAEEALGHVIGNSHDVVVATKVGPPRPPYNATKMRLRSLVKPVLDQVRSAKVLLGGVVGQAPRTSPRPRYDFSEAAIRRSLEASLQRLRRDRAEIFLAHEPHSEDLTGEVAARFEALVNQKLIGAYGVGIGEAMDRSVPFGSIWQSGWAGEQASAYTEDVTYIFHSVLRCAEKDRYGRTICPAGELIQRARLMRPDAVLLVSASTPGRLREIVDAVERPT